MVFLDDGIVYAAGALVWRHARRHADNKTAVTLEVLMVHRPRYNDWSWPKGKLEPGESLPECAVREVTEETGRRIILGQPLPGLEYTLGDGRQKQVRYWTARVASDDEMPAIFARPVIKMASVREIDEAVWVEVGEAAKRLTREADNGPLQALVALEATGALDTWAVIIQRHAKSVSRSVWERSEATRPLLPEGRARAKAGIPILSAFGVCEVASSPWRRCVDTMRPYITKARLGIVKMAELSEKSAAEKPGKATRVVTQMLSKRAGVVICGHRPVLPAMFAAVEAHCAADLRGSIPHKDPYLRTGEMLVLHVSRDPKASGGVSVRAIERHRPVVIVKKAL